MHGVTTQRPAACAKTLRRFVPVFLAAALPWGPVSPAGRFYIAGPGEIPLGSTGNAFAVEADLDTAIAAFSVRFLYDPAAVALSGFAPGAAVVPLEPEFAEGHLDPDSGDFIFGVLLDMSDPLTKTLAPGSGLELIAFALDAASPGEADTVLRFENDSGPPWRRNEISDPDGNRIPALALENRTVALRDFTPAITSLVSNSGGAGSVFFVVGENFQRGGVRVRVGPLPAAEVELLADGRTLRVVAPACEASGWVEVEVCTDFGCDVRAEGFLYDASCDPEPLAFVRGDGNDDGVVDVSDAVTVLLDLFRGRPSPAPCNDALDTDDDGRITVSDAIRLIEFLFLAGPEPPPPYPEPGPDPTGDALPCP